MQSNKSQTIPQDDWMAEQVVVVTAVEEETTLMHGRSLGTGQYSCLVRMPDGQEWVVRMHQRFYEGFGPLFVVGQQIGIYGIADRGSQVVYLKDAWVE